MRGRSATLAVLATPSRVQTIVRVATFAMLAVDLLWLALVALDPHRVPIGAREVARLSRSARWTEVPDREFIQSNTTYEHIDGPQGGRHIYTTTYIATLEGVTWRRTVTRDNYPDRPGPDDVIDLVRTPSMSELAVPFADCARSLPVRQPDPPVAQAGHLHLARLGDVSLFRCVYGPVVHHAAERVRVERYDAATSWTYGFRPDTRAIIASWLTLLAFGTVSALLLRQPLPRFTVAEVAPTAPGVAYREAASPSPTTPAVEPVSPWWARPFTPAEALRRLAFAWAAIVLGALCVFARVP